MTNQRNDSSGETNGSNEDQFVSLLVKSRHRLYAFIAKQLVNLDDTEDVYQQTCIVLWKKMEQYDPNASFIHWAFGIAFNEVRNFIRVKSRKKLCFDEELVALLAKEAEEESYTSERRLSALRECLSQLPPVQNKLVQQCYLGSQSISEVASTMGKERGAIYKQLARLKAKLASCIHQRIKLREG